VSNIASRRGYLMFNSIEINNFRCFKDVSISDLSRINVIVGDNGSGKTALLESIWLMSGANPNMAIRANVWRGILGQGFPVKDDHASFESVWNNFFHKLDMDQGISIHGTDSLRGKRSFTVERDRTIPIEIGETEDPELAIPLSFTWKSRSNKYKVIINSTGKAEISGTNKTFAAVFLSAANPHPGDDADRLAHLSKNREDQEVIKIMKEEFGIGGLTVLPQGPINLIFADVPALDRKVPVGLYSAGAKKFLSILLSIARYPKGVVAIDEIEAGFYYKHLRKIWKRLHSWSSPDKFNCQIFASTHSRECLEALLPVVEKHPKDFSLIRTERTEGGIVEISQFKGRNLKAALKQDMDVR